MTKDELVNSIFDKWKLTDDERNFLKSNLDNQDIISIYSKTSILFYGVKGYAAKWIHIKNDAFNNKSPLELLKENPQEGIRWINDYINSYTRK